MGFAGIDIGSLNTKAVIINDDCNILSYSILSTGVNPKKAAEKSFDRALVKAGLKRESIHCTVSTGYGRRNVTFVNNEVTEVTCHGRGVHFLFPEVKTVIDVGGQDSKAMTLNESGKITHFAMNDKCAAGTGRFLEVMAEALKVSLSRMGEACLSSREPTLIDSQCTVFAETEIISLIAGGADKLSIIAGLCQSVARRIMILVGRVGAIERIAFTGGVAKNIGVVKALEEMLATSVVVPEEPQITGALGAALIGHEKYVSGQ